jgi:hypothetical protein
VKSAAAAATQLSNNYRTLINDQKLQAFAQRDAWQGIVDLENAPDFQLRSALIQLRLARLYSDWAMTSAARVEAAKILGTAVAAASLTPPDSLKAGVLDDELASATKKANEAYGQADDMLTDSVNAPASGPIARDAKAGAQVLQVFSTYAHSRFAAAMGDKNNAAELLSQSKRMRDAATDANVALPPLPQGLAPVQQVATSAPAAPATAPTAPGAPAAAPPAGGDQGSSVFGNINGAPTGGATAPAAPGGKGPPAPQ